MTVSFEPYSVLMSVYAKEEPENLRLAMNSMWNQTAPPDEFVLVCDGPLTEGLDGVIDEMRQKHGSALNIVRLNDNCGLGRALQIGLEECHCGLVARMDSDDISRLNRCERLLSLMNTGALDIVGGAIEEFNHKPGDMGSVRRPPQGQSSIERFAVRRSPFNHVTVMFRKAAVEAAGGYETFPQVEDYWLWARMLMNGAQVDNVTDVVVDVRVGNGMYARRSSFAYLRSQRELFSRLSEAGFVSRAQVARALVERFIAAVVPIRMLEVAYRFLLRENQ